MNINEIVWAIIGLIWEIIDFFTALIRFFVFAPILATWVFFRSPRGIKKDRWLAWRLTRAQRLGRRLNDRQLKRLEDLAVRKLVRTITVPEVLEDETITWRRQEATFELIP